MSKRDAYVEKMKAQLDSLNDTMNTLEAKAREAKGEARDKYQAEMAKLKNQSQVARGKLDELKSASEDKWDALVAEMDKVRDAFVHSFNYFKSHF